MQATNYKQRLIQFIIPAFYSVVMLIVILWQWNGQIFIRQGSAGPLHRNLLEENVYIRRGFDPADIQIPSANQEMPGSAEWLSSVWIPFETRPLRISASPLPGLPKRTFLSPWGKETEEFTIISTVEIDSRAMAFINGSLEGRTPPIVPGIYLATIAENWEIFFNGQLVRSELHLTGASVDNGGRIKSRRTWRDVYFPLDSSLIKEGTNILAFRILADPSYLPSGFSYKTPYYLDEFRVIESRQRYLFLMVLSGIFGFTGVYYFMLFLSVRRKEEVFNLYFSIFSILLCLYSITRHGVVNSLIPNSDIYIRIEYGSLMVLMPVFCMFIETLGRGKVSKLTKGYLGLCLFFSLSQVFFCAQYGEDVLRIWQITVIIFYTYIVIYDVIYFYFWDKKGPKKNPDSKDADKFSSAYFFNILIGAVVINIFGVYEILDSLYFRNSFSLFVYSTFAVQIGMAFTLSQRFSGMYKRLEKSNTLLETAVHERTLELEEQTGIAVKASQTKTEFLANMSHEIRTPINSIVGFSELALDDKIAPKTKEYLGRIKENTIGLLQIINDILDISKVESGKIELERTPFDLNKVFTSCQTAIGPKAMEKGLTLHLYTEPPIGKRLLGDPTRLRQVLLNVLSNAVKFTNFGGVKASSWVKQSKGNNCIIHFEIRDSGIGMTDGQMKKIYEPFVQADASITRKYGGTGLGLPITKNLIELMGGELKVESTLNIGSKFSFDLPFDTIDASAIAATNFISFNELGRELEKPIFDAEILVCEDNTMNQKVIADHLARVGIKTVIAQNGKEGLDLVEGRLRSNEKPFDLIFMDIYMPVMDGLEAATKIAALNTGTPIVALTANIMSHDRELYKNNSIPDVVGKPFTSQELWHCLLKYLKPVSTETMEKKAEDEADLRLKKRFQQNFLKENRAKSGEITKALEAGDITLAHRLAHTLGGAAALIGKTYLQKLCANLEQLLNKALNQYPPQAEDWMENAAGLNKLLKTELNAILEEFEAIPDEITSTGKPGKKEALALLEQLKTKLKNRDPHCMNLLDDLSAIPGTEEIVRQVENFDFKPATVSIIKLIREMER